VNAVSEPQWTLKGLFLKDFRNYEEAFVEFSPTLNYLYGANAEGKTNLLEAIFLISTGKSFRTPKLTELIRSGANAFALGAEIEKGGISQIIEMRYDGREKQLRVNATTYRNFSPLLGMLPHVILTPEAIQFIQGAPLERRRFLDFHLAQSDPLYVHHYLRFIKAMKHRNHLLREKQQASIESWEELMAQSASYLIQERKRAIEELEPKVKKALLELSLQGEELALRYKPSLLLNDTGENLVTRIQNRLVRLRAREMVLGQTLTGPHRDDLELFISGKEARNFASEGQKRSCLVAVRLGEWQRLFERTEARPLFSIDDFAVHLDASRQTFLEKQITGLGQVFLTSPHPPTEALKIASCHTLFVKNGQVSPK
jgi:DNA replication and repair protein RecF